MTKRLLSSLPLLPPLVAAAGFVLLLLRTRRERRRVDADPQISVEALTDDTVLDDDGAVCSVQTGVVWVPTARLQDMWAPEYLERLARTYWFHLSRISFRLLRVMYTPQGRAMALFGVIPLITFREPEYELGGDRASVKWRINRGILVSRRSAEDGCLQILVRREESDRPGMDRVHLELRIANFYPAIAERLSRGLYSATQSRIHVFVVLSFLRSLAHGELAPSKIGRFAQWPREFDERRKARGVAARPGR